MLKSIRFLLCLAALCFSVAAIAGPQTYYLLAPESFAGDVKVVSLEPGNTITVGSYSLTLDQYQSASIPNAVLYSGVAIAGSKAFSLGSDPDATDLLVPAQFAGTSFVLPHVTGQHRYYLMTKNPAGATATLTVGTTTTNVPLTANSVVEVDGGSDNSSAARITATQNIFVAHVGVVSGAVRDAFPVPPAATTVVGLRSQVVTLAATSDATSGTVYASDGTSSGFSLDAGQQLTVAVGANGTQGQGSMLRVDANNPVMAIQTDDGDGNDATAFWPLALHTKRVALPVNAQYMAIACTSASVSVTLYRGSTAPDTQTCSGSSTNPGKVYFGGATNGANLLAGWYVLASSDVYAVYEAATQDDEHNLLGVTLPAGPAAPTLTAPPASTSSNPLAISGSGPANAPIRIYVNNKLAASGTANGSGAFTINTPLLDGVNFIYATALSGSDESAASNAESTTYTNGISRTQSGAISVNTVWTPGNPATPYVISANLTIAAGAELVIQPGTTLKMANGVIIATNGTLRVQGEPGNPVLLTCNAATCTKGIWNGLDALAATSNVQINYATIEWASTGVEINGGSGSVRNSTIRNFSTNGVWVQNVTNSTVIANNLIDNINDTVDCIETSSGSPTISGNTLTNCDNGINVYSNSSPVINGNNVITGNNYGIRLNGNGSQSPQPLINGNQIFANDNDDVIASGYPSGGQNIKINATGNWWGTTDKTTIEANINDLSDGWTSTTMPMVDFSNFLDGPNGAPILANYLIGQLTATSTTLNPGTIYDVIGVVFVPAAKSLTIPAGTQLRFHGDTFLVSYGTLAIQGVSGNPVILTSGRATPARGNWPGVVIRSNNALIEYAQLDYGATTVNLDGFSATVRNSTIRYFQDNGIWMNGAGASGSVIQNNLIDNFNDTGDCIETTSSSPTISGNTLQNCANGVYVYKSSSPTISGNIVTSNDCGLNLNGFSSYSPQPVINGNQLFSNDNCEVSAYGYASGGQNIKINATGNWWGTTDKTTIEAKINDLSDSWTSTSMPIVDFSNFLDGPNGAPVQANYLIGQLTASSTTLTAGAVYDVIGLLIVPTGKSLTIPAGTQLRFHGDTFLVSYGTLAIQGVSGNPVILTSGRATPARGDWPGVVIRSNNTLIEYAQLDYGATTIHLDGFSATVRNSTIRYFEDNGIWMNGAGASASVIQNNLIDNFNDTADCIETVSSSPTISGNTLQNCANGVYVYKGSSPTISSNIVTSNDCGININGYSTYSPQPVINGNQLFANDNCEVSAYSYASGGQNIKINATGNWWGTTDKPTIQAKITDLNDSWTATNRPVVDFSNFLDGPNGAPVLANYLIGQLTAASTTLTAGAVYDVIGALFVPAGKSLTIPAGTQLRFHGDTFLVSFGTLAIQGVNGNPVVLTSGSATPARGNWQGVLVRSNSTLIEYAQIDYTTTAVSIDGFSATVRNSTIRNFSDNGIWTNAAGASNALIQNNLIDNFNDTGDCVHTTSSSPSISGNTLQNCDTGVYVYKAASPTVTGNTITSNVAGIFINGYTTYSPLPVITGNQIFSNATYNLDTYNYANGAQNLKVNATGNWWGTADLFAIAATINDYADTADTNYPNVDFSNPLDGPGGSPIPGNYLVGPLSASTTLTAGQTYETIGLLTVPAAMTLTIPANTVLRFYGASARITVDGTLQVQGTSETPVIFTSARQAPARGDWTGIEGRAGANIVIDNALIEYATRAVNVSDATVVVRNSRIYRYSVAGVVMGPVLAGSEIRNCLIDNFSELNGSSVYGIYLNGASPLITGNRIQGNRFGIYALGASSPTITSNVIKDNVWGIYLKGNGSNSATGNPNPVITGNDFIGNTTAGLELNSFGATNPIVVNASGNYWGVATPVIGTHIRVSGGAVATQINFSSYSSSSLNGAAASSLTVSDFFFSPNGDTVQDTTALASSLSQSASWSIKVRAPSGAVVREFTGTGTTVAVTWDGRDSGSQVLPDGTYLFELSNAAVPGQILAASSSTVDNTVPVSVMGSPTNGAVLTNISAIDLTGSANDQHFLNYVLEYGAGTTPTSWNNFKTSTAQVQSAVLGTLTVATANGSVAITGPNVLRLTVTDTAGNVGVVSAAVTVDNIAASAITQNTNLIRPLLGEQLTVNFTLSGPATASLQIYPDLGGPMLREVTQVFATGGAKSLSWNGRDAANNFVPDEAYRYVVQLTEGARITTYDPPDIDNVGSNSGTVDSTFNANANDFFKMNLNVSDVKARIRMQVSGCATPTHYPYNWVPVVQGVFPIMWDGRDANGALTSGVCNIYFDPPDPLRPFSVIVKGTNPQITGKRAAPNLEVGAEPYIVVHSYDQIGRFTYRVSLDSNVTVKLLPPGVTNFADSSAITLVNNVFQTALSGGLPADYMVEWTGNDGIDTNNILVSVEGTYTIAIQATSAATGRTTLYRGSLQLYQ